MVDAPRLDAYTVQWRDDARDALETAFIRALRGGLRHPFAAWHLKAGASRDDLARALGHTGTAMLHRIHGPRPLRSSQHAHSGRIPRMFPAEQRKRRNGRVKATREEALPRGVSEGFERVGRVGVEPTTNGLKVRCSTD